MTARRLALISVSDKTGVVDLARGLSARGFAILSTGGTARALEGAGLRVVEVPAHTGHPEILGGRVKTLHPKIHGGILADLSNAAHRAEIERSGIEPIELVVVNLYPFREVAGRPEAALADLVESIDIGGPAMVRSAAKNFDRVAVVVDPGDYAAVLEEIAGRGSLSEATRRRLAARAFAHTAEYDAAIHDALKRRFAPQGGAPGPAGESHGPAGGDFPGRLTLAFDLRAVLRYGENPHQRGALYRDAAAAGGIADARQLQGKDLSYNNILDLDAAWRVALEFDSPAAAIIKHNNPCGVAVGATLEEAFRKARETDPISSFGGIVAFNREVDAAAATAVATLFLECVIAPAYAPGALEALAGRAALRVMQVGVGPGRGFEGLDLRRVSGGVLVQDWDRVATDLGRARVVSRRAPTADETRALDFAWRVARHVKSNAIVLARPGRTVGIGAGQMSRLDSVQLAAGKAREATAGTVMASDAFFPFRDGIDAAARAGVTAVVQPGGSVKDEEVIAAADEHGMAMIVTGVRHFRH